MTLTHQTPAPIPPLGATPAGGKAATHEQKGPICRDECNRDLGHVFEAFNRRQMLWDAIRHPTPLVAAVIVPVVFITTLILAHLGWTALLEWTWEQR